MDGIPLSPLSTTSLRNRKMSQPLEIAGDGRGPSPKLISMSSMSMCRRSRTFSRHVINFLRNLTNESGRQSALSLANALLEARNSPDGLEVAVCDGFRSLGFDVTPLGKSGEPDGVAAAHLSADDRGTSRHYRVSLEAKSKRVSGSTVSAKDVGIAAVRSTSGQTRMRACDCHRTGISNL